MYLEASATVQKVPQRVVDVSGSWQFIQKPLSIWPDETQVEIVVVSRGAFEGQHTLGVTTAHARFFDDVAQPYQKTEGCAAAVNALFVMLGLGRLFVGARYEINLESDIRPMLLAYLNNLSAQGWELFTPLPELTSSFILNKPSTEDPVEVLTFRVGSTFILRRQVSK